MLDGEGEAATYTSSVECCYIGVVPLVGKHGGKSLIESVLGCT